MNRRGVVAQYQTVARLKAPAAPQAVRRDYAALVSLHLRRLIERCEARERQGGAA